MIKPEILTTLNFGEALLGIDVFGSGCNLYSDRYIIIIKLAAIAICDECNDNNVCICMTSEKNQQESLSHYH